MQSRPNILFVMADDHAAHAISAYDSRTNRTPGIDRIAAEGMRLDACFCTNSLCSPSRAAILTGTYNHVNGVTSNSPDFDARQPTFVRLLQDAGYQTSIVGKWHLGHGGIHDPVGFDRWSVFPDHGRYHDPEFLEPGGRTVLRPGYYAEPCGQPCAHEAPRTPAWELFDLERDPRELHSVYDDPAYAAVRAGLIDELERLQDELGDTDCAPVRDARR